MLSLVSEVSPPAEGPVHSLALLSPVIPSSTLGHCGSWLVGTEWGGCRDPTCLPQGLWSLVRSSASAGLRTQGHRTASPPHSCRSLDLPFPVSSLLPPPQRLSLSSGLRGAVRWRHSGQGLCCPPRALGCMLHLNPLVLWRGDQATALKFSPGAACWAQVTLSSGEDGVQAGEVAPQSAGRLWVLPGTISVG